ncbi:hypothetical protein SDJN03_28553, partial [Cucurbita argyrosperma subsp. sororia]
MGLLSWWKGGSAPSESNSKPQPPPKNVSQPAEVPGLNVSPSPVTAPSPTISSPAAGRFCLQAAPTRLFFASSSEVLEMFMEATRICLNDYWFCWPEASWNHSRELQ